MTTVVVLGANGFIGKHATEAMALEGFHVMPVGRDASAAEFDAALASADVVVHLAGANRPADPAAFQAINVGVTQKVCDRLLAGGRATKLIFASSRQAELDNAYGRSKLAAEEVVRDYAARAGAPAAIFRLTNVYGRGCRPDYNSFVATLCHRVAKSEPFHVDDPSKSVRLVYVDDVVKAIVGAVRESLPFGEATFLAAGPEDEVRLAELVAHVRSFRDLRSGLVVPDMSSRFVKQLYATYLSYLPETGFGYALDIRSDSRGSLAEFLKSPRFGQLFVSRTHPGITRGNHFHHTKTEKFFVVNGEALIRFRKPADSEVVEYHVNGRDYRVLDIPPGYSHSIENVGDSELVVLFWASEPFDPANPDTYSCQVLEAEA